MSIEIGDILSETDGKPHGWNELARKDKMNIRQFVKRRRRQGASSEELRHDLRNLVGLASMKAEGSLSTANISEFGDVKTRPTRVLPQFLIFTGSETPKCPKCGSAEYEPSKNHPEKMRCVKCSFLYSEQELASWISPK